jgi:hypothetical protein
MSYTVVNVLAHILGVIREVSLRDVSETHGS